MQAFSNIRVIDLTHVIAGPFCTYQLAVMGADVIKVEPPQNPDISRYSSAPPNENESATSAELSSDFVAQNANKRAVSIDLKSVEGKEIMHAMLNNADILVENYRSGAMAKIGLDYPTVRSIQPDIIYCSITGFGQQGTNANRTAYDNVIQAYSGLMAATGDHDTAPIKVGPPVLDYGTGMQAAFAVAAALYQRSVTGKGQYIDVAMLDAALMLMSSNITEFQQSGKLSPLTGNNSAVHAGYCCYPTQQGLLMLGAYNGTQAKNMWAVLGDMEYGKTLAELKPTQMHAHFARDQQRIAEILLGKTAEQWETEFNHQQVPAARVRTLDQTLADPQINARTVLQPIDNCSIPKLPVAAFQYAHNGPTITHAPPVLGQHTKEVLTELGYSAVKIKQLHQQGVIQIADQ